MRRTKIVATIGPASRDMDTLTRMVQAGLDGVRTRRPIDEAGGAPLPGSLAAALDLLDATAESRGWFGAAFVDGYLAFKRAELAGLADLDETEICRRYAAVY